jgi:gluconolactonase
MTVTPLEVINRSSELERLLFEGSEIECLSTGFRWAEGPVWIASEAAIIFSDVSGNAMYRWNDDDGLNIFRQPSGYSNGNTLDPQGRIVTCEHQHRRVSRTDRNGQVVNLASSFEGKRLNSPNDVVVKSDGNIYFTDPPDGLTPQWGVPGIKELPYQGVFRLSPNGQDLTLEARDFQTPNGIALSPNEKILYVDDTDRMEVRRFEIRDDGSLGDGSIFAKLDPSIGPGWPDGLKTDYIGNVYVTGPGGIWVFNSDGSLLGILRLPETTTNLNWGGPSLSDLYITTATEEFVGSGLYRLRLRVSGFYACY